MVASIERVREVRERLVSAGTVVGPDGRSRELFPVAIGVEEGAALLSSCHRADVSPYAEAGATWWMTELEPGVSLDTVRGVIRDGPAE